MKKHGSWLLWGGGLCSAIFLIAGVAWGQSAKSEAAPLSEKARKGKQIFQDACFLCHDKDSDRVPLLGPSLDGLFKRKALVSGGKPVTAENVKEVIKMGTTSAMPGFRYALSEQEIDEVVEFLKTK